MWRREIFKYLTSLTLSVPISPSMHICTSTLYFDNDHVMLDEDAQPRYRGCKVDEWGQRTWNIKRDRRYVHPSCVKDGWMMYVCVCMSNDMYVHRVQAYVLVNVLCMLCVYVKWYVFCVCCVSGKWYVCAWCLRLIHMHACKSILTSGFHGTLSTVGVIRLHLCFCRSDLPSILCLLL